MTLFPLALMLPILGIAAYTDLTKMKIPNKLSLIGIILFAVCMPFLPLEETGLRILTAAIVFAVMFALFAIGLFGGGDVKLLSVLMLFIPSNSLFAFAYIFSVSMLFGIAIVLLLQTFPRLVPSHWLSAQRKGHFPMGISIALAGVLCFGWNFQIF